MHADWRSFLISAGAVLSGGRINHFKNLQEEVSAALAGDIVVDLSHLGLLAAEGADAGAFLQGQLTNDIFAVSETCAQLSASCSPKGRVLASFLIFLRTGTFFLQLPQDLIDSLLKRLRLYVLRAAVSLSDASDTLIRIGVCGWQAQDQLQKMLATLPSARHHVTQPAPFTVIRLRGERPRYEILGPYEPMRALWTTLTRVSCPTGPGTWSLLDICEGIPTISRDTSDLFLPQMLNWDALNGISFTKGCYTGQEIVARSQYLGKVKRRLYRARVHKAGTVQRATPLIATDGQAPRNVGQVVNAACHAEGRWDLLAVISTEEAKQASIHLHDATGPVLELMALPYRLESGPST